jgi:hypothetical protein
MVRGFEAFATRLAVYSQTPLPVARLTRCVRERGILNSLISDAAFPADNSDEESARQVLLSALPHLIRDGERTPTAAYATAS